MYYKKIFLIALVTSLAGLGCAGRAAYPVSTSQYGDSQKSCEALGKETTFVESEANRLIPETKKTGKNTALGVAGVFLVVPWFFMDFTEAEQIEVNALRQRYNHLVILAEEKKCGLNKAAIPAFDHQEASDGNS